VPVLVERRRKVARSCRHLLLRNRVPVPFPLLLQVLLPLPLVVKIALLVRSSAKLEARFAWSLMELLRLFPTPKSPFRSL
jgi:hypothetical protein